MGLKFAAMTMRIVEVTFFTGLAGCAVVVILSWISVIKGCLTDKG